MVRTQLQGFSTNTFQDLGKFSYRATPHASSVQCLAGVVLYLLFLAELFYPALIRIDFIKDPPARSYRLIEALYEPIPSEQASEPEE